LFWRVASRPLFVRGGRVAGRIRWAIAWSTGHEVGGLEDEMSDFGGGVEWKIEEKTEEIAGALCLPAGRGGG